MSPLQILLMEFFLPQDVPTLGFVCGIFFLPRHVPTLCFVCGNFFSRDVPTLGFVCGFFFHLGMSPLQVFSMEIFFHLGMSPIQDLSVDFFFQLRMSPFQVLSMEKNFTSRCPHFRFCPWKFFSLCDLPTLGVVHGTFFYIGKSAFYVSPVSPLQVLSEEKKITLGCPYFRFCPWKNIYLGMSPLQVYFCRKKIFSGCPHFRF